MLHDVMISQTHSDELQHKCGSSPREPQAHQGRLHDQLLHARTGRSCIPARPKTCNA